MPDPQDPGTFERSRLTRAGEPAGLRELHAALLRLRRELPPGDAGAIEHDEHRGWLRVARGPYRVLASFSRERVHVPLDGTAALVLATGHATLEPGAVVLAPLCGAVLRIG